MILNRPFNDLEKDSVVEAMNRLSRNQYFVDLQKKITVQSSSLSAKTLKMCDLLYEAGFWLGEEFEKVKQEKLVTIARKSANDEKENV